MEELGGQTGGVARLADDGVHLAVNSDAPVAGPLERLLGEPVVPVPPTEDLNEAVSKFSQLALAHISLTQSNEMDQKIRRGLDF